VIMSRYLHCIGDKKRRDDKPGLGLVEVKIDPVRADRRQVFLTEPRVNIRAGLTRMPAGARRAARKTLDTRKTML